MVYVSEPLPPGTLPTLAAILGLIFGSFITALSYRLPRGISIAKGRSGCPACGAVLTARDLVPVLSWLINRGACRSCKVQISWRYPAIEVVMAALFVVATIVIGDEPRLIVVLAATPIMVALAVVDLEYRRLPNVLLACLTATVLVFRYLHDTNFVIAFASAALVFGFCLALDWIGRRAIQQGLGMGDAKLMAVVALALPPVPMLLVLGCAGLLGTIAGLLLRKGNTGLSAQVPLGPALVASLWIALVAL